MRIIGGQARGRRLFAPEGMDTRPTSDKVRESLFNMIRMYVEDARVLDLFAGSGAMALEAISRGAASAAMVDVSRKASAVIHRNVSLLGAEDQCEVLTCDWHTALSQLKDHQFSLVFLDPPYRMFDAYGQAISCLIGWDMLEEDALITLEYAKGSRPHLPEKCVVYEERRYGDTMIALARVKAEEDM